MTDTDTIPGDAEGLRKYVNERDGRSPPPETSSEPEPPVIDFASDRKPDEGQSLRKATALDEACAVIAPYWGRNGARFLKLSEARAMNYQDPGNAALA